MKLDESKAAQILNKRVIVGITMLDHEENFVEQQQYHGIIVRINANEGVVIKLAGSGQEYKLPPALEAFKEAPPGEYRFKSTGEVVVNPDLMTTWTLRKPKD